MELGVGVEERFLSLGKELFANFQMLLERNALTNAGQDKWCWNRDPSGNYSVRSAYKFLQDFTAANEDQFLKELWQSGAPLKVIVFGW